MQLPSFTLLPNIITISTMSGILPLMIYNDLSNHDKFKTELHRIGGVYGFIHINKEEVKKKYIGSSKDLYQRFLDHFKGRDSNIQLQRAMRSKKNMVLKILIL